MEAAGGASTSAARRELGAARSSAWRMAGPGGAITRAAPRQLKQAARHTASRMAEAGGVRRRAAPTRACIRSLRRLNQVFYPVASAIVGDDEVERQPVKNFRAHARLCARATHPMSTRPALSLSTHRQTRCRTAMKKVASRNSIGFGTARQRMVLERWTNPKPQRRTRSPRYEVQYWVGELAGVAKRPCEAISHPKSLRSRFAAFSIAVRGRGGRTL
jgi:hypothetical protein